MYQSPILSSNSEKKSLFPFPGSDLCLLKVREQASKPALPPPSPGPHCCYAHSTRRTMSLASGQRPRGSSTWTDVSDPKVCVNPSNSQALLLRLLVAGAPCCPAHRSPSQLSATLYRSSKYSMRTLPMSSSYSSRSNPPPLNLKAFRFSTQVDPPTRTKSPDALSPKRLGDKSLPNSPGNFTSRKGKNSAESTDSSPEGYGAPEFFLPHPAINRTRLQTIPSLQTAQLHPPSLPNMSRLATRLRHHLPALAPLSIATGTAAVLLPPLCPFYVGCASLTGCTL